MNETPPAALACAWFGDSWGRQRPLQRAVFTGQRDGEIRYWGEDKTEGGKGNEDIVRVRNNLFSLCSDGCWAPLPPWVQTSQDFAGWTDFHRKSFSCLSLSAFTDTQGNQIPQLHKMHVDAVVRRESSQSGPNVARLSRTTLLIRLCSFICCSPEGKKRSVVFWRLVGT